MQVQCTISDGGDAAAGFELCFKVLSRESDLDGDGPVYGFVKVYDKVAEKIVTQMCLNVWEISEEDRFLQLFLLYVLYHPNIWFWENNLFKMAVNNPGSKRSKKPQTRLNICDVSCLLGASYGTVGMFLKKSAIKHLDARKGGFAGLLIVVG